MNAHAAEYVVTDKAILKTKGDPLIPGSTIEVNGHRPIVPSDYTEETYKGRIIRNYAVEMDDGTYLALAEILARQ